MGEEAHWWQPSREVWSSTMNSTEFLDVGSRCESNATCEVETCSHEGWPPAAWPVFSLAFLLSLVTSLGTGLRLSDPTFRKPPTSGPVFYLWKPNVTDPAMRTPFSANNVSQSGVADSNGRTDPLINRTLPLQSFPHCCLYTRLKTCTNKHKPNQGGLWTTLPQVNAQVTPYRSQNASILQGSHPPSLEVEQVRKEPRGGHTPKYALSLPCRTPQNPKRHWILEEGSPCLWDTHTDGFRAVTERFLSKQNRISPT